MANKILPVADALKQLYQSLGGDDPEVLDMSTNTELIQEIAKVATSGGSGLPEVTDVDEGKVLTVDSSGEWAAEMPSKGYPYVYATASGFISGTSLGYFVVGKLRATDIYELVRPTSSSVFIFTDLYVNDFTPQTYLFPSQFPAELPEGLVLLWVENNDGSIAYTYSGKISQTLYGYYNDSGANGCRIVTGNFELTAVVD